jgi:pectinesterase
MLSKEDFVNSPLLEAKDFAQALEICGDFRKKDPTDRCIVHLQNGLSEGNFVFPYSDFMISCDEGAHEISGSRYAKMLDEKGQELSTWKTATLKVTGNHNLFENLEIKNTAGDPENKGQEVALAVYGDDNLFLKCALSSTQDTLFVGPLPDDLSTRYLGFIPEDERYHEGNCRNYFFHCAIFGSVDFIFGAGQADFLECAIGSIDDGRETSYVCAPAHSLKDDFGFLFYQCSFIAAGAKKSSVYLARPWRDYGKAVFVECAYGAHIKPEGFSEWNTEKRYLTARFEEYPLQKGRVSWVKNKESAPLEERYCAEIAQLKLVD